MNTVDSAASLLQNQTGEIGNLTIRKHLVELKPKGEALVISDLHGDLESLNAILQKSGFLEKMQTSPDATLIFLGDYGDRGSQSAEVYFVVLKLLLAFPGQLVLLRGNHEAPERLLGEPHDLPNRFQERFGEDWLLVYEKIKALWACLYNAVFVENRYLMVHGGVSPEIRGLQDIAEAQENHKEEVLEDLLWSDPREEVAGVSAWPRGAGKHFGKDVTEQVLAKLNAKILIRGHEASPEGFKINHDGKVLTLFSRKGAPYFNRYGVYLQLPLSETFIDAKELLSFIHKF